jgi:LysM repeat protein
MSQKQKIKSGDTLSQIAKNRGTTLKALLAANPSIKNANSIRVGQSITIPTKQMSPGDAKRNPYEGTFRSELKGHDDQTQDNKKQANEFSGTGKKKKKFNTARSRAATKNSILRSRKEEHNRS